MKNLEEEKSDDGWEMDYWPDGYFVGQQIGG